MNAVSGPALADPAGPARSIASRWADLRTRTLSAILLGPLVLVCIWLGGSAWGLLMLATAAGLGVEWAHLCGAARGPGTSGPGTSGPGTWAPVVLVLAVGAAMANHWGAAAAIPLLGGAVVTLGWRRPILGAGVAYLGLAVLALLWLRAGPAGFATVLFLVLVVWASDIGAYMTGRLLGGPKLAPAISPGKTWSGSLGGLAAAMLVGLLAAHWLGTGIAGWSALRGAGWAAVLGVSAQAGDLLESWIKRQFGVKDSGKWIPGHGGLLDRLDGLTAAALAAVLLASVSGQGETVWN